MKIGSGAIVKFTERNTLSQKDMFNSIMKIFEKYNFDVIKKNGLLLKNCLFKKDNAFYKFVIMEQFYNWDAQQIEISYIELKEICE